MRRGGFAAKVPAGVDFMAFCMCEKKSGACKISGNISFYETLQRYRQKICSLCILVWRFKMAKASETRSAEEKDIETQIKDLRSEISALVSNLNKAGQEKIRHVKRRAAHFLDDAREHGGDALQGAQQKFYDMQEELSDNIREKPMTSIAIAAGVGFVLAHLLRR